MAPPDRPIDATLAVAADAYHVVVALPRGWETTVVLLGVQLAQILTVLLATACVLLGLLALVAHFRPQLPTQVPQPVYVRRIVRRTGGRPRSADLTPLPSRDPPPFPPLSRTDGTDDPDLF
jgi:hypothetical protein